MSRIVDASSHEAGTTYYDRPVLSEPVWIWAVPAYFYAGGVSGAASILGGAAQLLGGGRTRRLVRRCRALSAAGSAAGTALLIYDLGKPSRFLNMLRVFRATSPMSVGSWVLAAFSGASTAAAGSELVGDRRLRRVGDAAGMGAAALGVPMTGYTATLLTTSAVPVWQAVCRSLPVLFAASSAAGTASLLDLLDASDDEQRVVKRFGVAAKAAELAAAQAVEMQAMVVEEVGRPLKQGAAGWMWRLAKASTAVSLVLSLLPGGGRAKRVASGVAGTVGSVSVRFAVFHAGFGSARDPRATFRSQRMGYGASEVTGDAGVVGPGSRRAFPS